MDKCFICGSKENLWYCYPVPGGGITRGLKLCLEHRTIMEQTPLEFKEMIDKIDSKKKGGK